MTGRLTTHVLDTAEGCPAAGLELDLFRLRDGGREHLGRFRTNADGRCDAPLLAGAALEAAEYEIVFAVAEWRASRGQAGQGFYAAIPVRFRIADPGAHHHVPLLLSPFGYGTYRGS